MILMRCAAVPIDATVRLVDLGPMTPPPTAWAGLPIWLMPTAGKGCAWSATRRLSEWETAPAWGQNAGAATFSRFVSTIPRERWIRLSAASGVPKNRPRTRAGGSAIVRVVFTSGQTLPSFPAYIGMPDGYPLLRLAIW